MQPIAVLAPYAAVLGVIMAVLSLRVSFARARSGISLGVGEDRALLARVRSFGNFTEWVPMALLMLTLGALTGMPVALLHGLGGLLVLARLLHLVGMLAPRPVLIGRIAGTAGTIGVIVTAAGWLVFWA